MEYYLYHIPGKKIGVTCDLNSRLTKQQGYKPGEYEVLVSSDDIDYISDKEAELQLVYGYKVDRDSYKDLVTRKKSKNKKQLKSNQMNVNVTEQTTTFPCPLNKLKGNLMDAKGFTFDTPFGSHELDNNLVNWITNNAKVSMYNPNRCYVYNKAMYEFDKKQNSVNTVMTKDPTAEDAISAFFEEISKRFNLKSEPVEVDTPSNSIFDDIRAWATTRGIYQKGDSKTQYVKLMEEAGELAQAILKRDEPEIKDAIGDMVVVLTNLAHLEGLTIEQCIGSAYDVISKRQGKMVNGTFVKQTL